LKEWLQIALNRGNDKIRTLGKGSASVAIEAVLVCVDPDNGKPDACRGGTDDRDIPNLGNGQAPERSDG
jgi:hypothetical protein